MENVILIRSRCQAKSRAEIMNQELKLNATIGAHLKKWREASGVLFDESLAKLGVSVEEFLSWEIGAVSPSARKFCAFVVALGFDVALEAATLANELNVQAQMLRQDLENAELIREYRFNSEALGAAYRRAA